MKTAIEHGTKLTHQRVRDYVRSQLGRRWKTGDRLPPIEVLAEDMGVGRINTLRAIRTLVEEGYLASRPRLGTVVISETPVATTTIGGRAAGLSGRMIRVLVGSTCDAFGRAAMRGVTRRLGDRGAQVEIVESHAKSAAMANLGLHDSADAVVAINPLVGTLSGGREDQILSVISTENEFMLSRERNYDVVSVDSVQGGLVAGKWLREIGATSACFLGVCHDGGQTYEATSALRLRGMQEGLGIAIAAQHLMHAMHYTVECGVMLVQQYVKLRHPPRAIFAASDELAVGFIFGMLGRGLFPGKDYQIVGFDGQVRGRGLHCGPLTTVEVPMERMGSMAADMLIERFADPDSPPRRVSVGCELFKGRTAVAAGAKRSQ